MQTIAIISQKGGAGKTTLSIQLGFAAHTAGLATAIIDLDPQGTAAKWADRRRAGPQVMGGQASRLNVILDAVRANGADLALIDTPPSAEAIALAAAKAADLVLVPTRPSGFDLEAIQTTLEMAEFARRRAIVLVNAVPCNRSHLGTSTVAGLRQRGFEVAPVMWMERAAFADLGADGLTAQERDAASKASLEVVELFRWLCQQAGMPTSPQAGQPTCGLEALPPSGLETMRASSVETIQASRPET
jgi:chromosome partitioning protein